MATETTIMYSHESETFTSPALRIGVKVAVRVKGHQFFLARYRNVQEKDICGERYLWGKMYIFTRPGLPISYDILLNCPVSYK